MAIVMMATRVYSLNRYVYRDISERAIEAMVDMTGKVSPYVHRVVIGPGEIEDMFRVRRSSDMWLETIVFSSFDEKEAYERGEVIVPVMKLRGPETFRSME
jgi:hypothetical protein